MKKIFSPYKINEKFVQIISKYMSANIEKYSGLLEPIYTISTGDMTNKNSVFAEWCQRSTPKGTDTVPKKSRAIAKCFQRPKQTDKNADENYFDLISNKFADYADWNEQRTKIMAQTIVQALFETGAVRDMHDQLIVDEDTDRCYLPFSGISFQLSQVVRIIRPCWTYKGKILEMGIIKQMEDK